MTSRNQREGVYLGFFGKHWRGKVSTLIRAPKSVYGCIRLCVKEAEKRCSAEDREPTDEQVDKLTSWAIKRMQEQDVKIYLPCSTAALPKALNDIEDWNAKQK